MYFLCCFVVSVTSEASPATMVAVTDLSDKERARMEHERQDMMDERKHIQDERRAMDREVTQLGSQREDLQAKLKQTQDQLNQANKVSSNIVISGRLNNNTRFGESDEFLGDNAKVCSSH